MALIRSSHLSVLLVLLLIIMVVRNSVRVASSDSFTLQTNISRDISEIVSQLAILKEQREEYYSLKETYESHLKASTVKEAQLTDELETTKKELDMIKLPANETEAVYVQKIIVLKTFFDANINASKATIQSLNEQIIKTAAVAEIRRISRQRLGILTIHTPPYYKTWANWTINNHHKYAKKHGYGMYIENGKSDLRKPVWSKIMALLRHMEDDRHDWYWAFDLDTMIMNATVRAEDLLDDSYDLIFQRDWNWFNAGSFFIKNSEWSKNYLRQVLNVTKPDPAYFEEQAALYVS